MEIMTETPLDRVFKEVDTEAEFAFCYGEEIRKVMYTLDFKSIGYLIGVFEAARRRGAHIYFIGNGGKAALCDEWVNDLSVALPDKPFKVHSLMGRVSALTAASNDYDWDTALMRILEPLINKNDLLVALSGSGESNNIIIAVQCANARGMQTVGIGRGGALEIIAKLFIKIPAEDDGPTEDAIMSIIHMCHHWFIRKDRG
jgi:D-sedoheptulose 7-phosphate isomerase